MSDCDETPIDDVSRALAEFEQIEKEADAFLDEFYLGHEVLTHV